MQTSILSGVDSKSQKAKKNKGRWCQKEIKLLYDAVESFGCNWFQISEQIPNRNPNQCAQKWKRLKGERSRQNKFWNKAEDKKLLELVDKYGKQWTVVARKMHNRNSKQCRDRYVNTLNPALKSEDFSKDEDDLIYQKYIQQGPRWSTISKQLDGRSENQVKNRFYTHIREHYLQIKNPYCNKVSIEQVKEMMLVARESHLIYFSKQMEENQPEEVEQLTTEESLSHYFVFSNPNIQDENQQSHSKMVEEV